MARPELGGRRQTGSVLVLSDVECEGGAAVAATRVANGLGVRGLQVSRLAGRLGHQVAYSVPPRVGSLKPTLERLPWGVRGAAWRLLPRGLVQRASTREALRRIRAWRREHPFDLINVHNVHVQRTWSPDLVEGLTKIAPVVWTLHDMWPLTGSCAQSFECRRFTSQCDASCPHPNQIPNPAPSGIAAAHAVKQRIFRSGKIHGVAPSRWLHDTALAAGWPADRLHHIPHAVDRSAYTPGDRPALKASLGLPPDVPLLLSVTSNPRDPYKGMSLLAEALSRLEIRPLSLVTFGAPCPLPALRGVKRLDLGFLHTREALARVYGAADVFVFASVAETLGLVLLEAMACGCPLVGFERGGIPEAIRNGETGRLATEVTGAALAAAAEAVLADPPSPAQVREVAEREFNLDAELDGYMSVFDTILGA